MSNAVTVLYHAVIMLRDAVTVLCDAIAVLSCCERDVLSVERHLLFVVPIERVLWCFLLNATVSVRNLLVCVWCYFCDVLEADHGVLDK
jgi:hypothetical protein